MTVTAGMQNETNSWIIHIQEGNRIRQSVNDMIIKLAGSPLNTLGPSIDGIGLIQHVNN